MKHNFIGMMIALALVLALLTGAALAENAQPEVPEAPAIEQTQPEEAPDADNSALQEALNAYREAKAATRLEALEAELKGYVEAGKLTQEQADLILNSIKERQSMRSGSCPNCGGQLRKGQGGRMNGGFGNRSGRMNGGFGNRNGRMNGGFGNRNGRMNGGFGGWMNGGRGMMNPQASQAQNGDSADGTGAQPVPDMADGEGR